MTDKKKPPQKERQEKQREHQKRAVREGLVAPCRESAAEYEERRMFRELDNLASSGQDS